MHNIVDIRWNKVSGNFEIDAEIGSEPQGSQSLMIDIKKP